MAQSSRKILGPGAFKTITSRAITEADTDATTELFEIPAGSFVPPFGVSIQITEAFAGGTPSIDVGDSDTDGWIDTTDITEGTEGTYTGDGTAYAPTGKYYSTKDTLDVTLSADLTDGTAYVIMRYWDMTACDLAAN